MFGVHEAYFNTQKYYAQGVNVLDTFNASTYHHGMHIGKVIEALAERAGLSDNALADRAGMKQPTVTRILNGESADPRRSNIERLASVFGYSADQMYAMAASGNLVFDDNGVHRKKYVAETPTSSPENFMAAEKNESQRIFLLDEAHEANLIEEIHAREIPPHIEQAIMALLQTCKPKPVAATPADPRSDALKAFDRLLDSLPEDQLYLFVGVREQFLSGGGRGFVSPDVYESGSADPIQADDDQQKQSGAQ